MDSLTAPLIHKSLANAVAEPAGDRVATANDAVMNGASDGEDHLDDVVVLRRSTGNLAGLGAASGGKGGKGGVGGGRAEEVAALSGGHGGGGGGLWGAVFNLATTSVGAGIMALPATVKVLGLPLGLLLIALMGALTHSAVLIIVRLAAATNSQSYGHLMGTRFGERGRVLCEVMVMVQALGSLIVYLIITADVLSGTSEAGGMVHHVGLLEELAGGPTWWNGRAVVLLAVTTLVLLPLVLLRRIDSLMATSALSVGLAVLFVLFTAAAAVMRVVQGRLPPLRMVPDVSSWQSVLLIFTVVPVMTNAFICHYNVQPIYRELKDSPSCIAPAATMERAAGLAQVICTALYGTTALFAYLLFGDSTAADVLANYDQDLGLSQAMDDIVRVGYIVHLLLVFPIVHFPLRLTADILLFPKARLPLWRSQRRFFWLTAATMGFILACGVLVPDIYALFSLLGAIVAVSIGFTFPALLALLTPGLTFTCTERVAVWSMLVVGVAVSITGVTSDVIVACQWLSRLHQPPSEPHLPPNAPLFLQSSIPLAGHSYPTTVARISPNGEWVASADVSGTVRVWGRGGERRLKYEIKALNGPIDDLQWSPDGQRILVCGDGKPTYVRAFTWDSGGNLGDFEGHAKRVLSCAFRPARPFRAFTCGEDFAINYYEGPPFRYKASNKEHGNYVNCVRFSPDGALLVSVSSDRQGQLFDGKTGEKRGALSTDDAHTGSVYAAAWSPDGKQLLTVSADKTAKVWDVAADGSTATVTTTFPLGSSLDHMQVGCAWVGEHLITVALNGDIHFLSPASPSAPLRTLVGHCKPITALALFSPGGGDAGAPTELVTGSYDGTVVRWNIETGSLGRMEAPAAAAAATPGAAGGAAAGGVAAMAAAGSTLLLACNDDTVHLLSLPDLTPISDTPTIALGAHPKDISIAAHDPDLALLTTASGLTLLRSSKLLSSITPAFTPTAAALSPDGKEAAVGGEDGAVRVFSVNGDTMEEVAKLERHRGPITAVRYSPDGSMLATGDQNREAVVWDTATREVKMRNMVYHTARISALAWSPDSTHVATASLDMSILVYDVSKPPSDRVTLKNAHVGGVSALAFVDATTIVSAGNDACVRLWSLA
ncbi:unnamed protein product [Closterium sp. Naga37s-1]|nr:unnamed protein product [Closterium sp. Naga37s-1]